MRSIPYTTAAVSLVAAAACGGGKSATAPLTSTFQIASVVANPQVSECSTNSTSRYTTGYVLHLVNTTAGAVTVSGVSSSGQVIRSTRPDEVGMAWNTFASLPFDPAVVAAHDYLDMNVTLSSSCLPHPAVVPPMPDEFRDVYTTLRVTTNTGMYATQQISTTIQYRASPFGALDPSARRPE